MEKLIKNLDTFLFPKINYSSLGKFRFSFGVILVLSILLFWSQALFLFSDSGFISSSDFYKTIGEERWSVFLLNDTTEFVDLCRWILIISSVLFTIGIYPRFNAAISLILWISFFNRLPWIFHAGDMIIIFVLFVFCFLDSSSYKKVNGWPLRLLEVQLGILYFFAAVSKTHSKMWMNGIHTYSMMNLPGRGYFNLLFMDQFPLVISLMTYFVIVSEFVFIWLVYFSSTRKLAYSLVALTHIGILFSTNTNYFSEMMLVLLAGCYFCLPKSLAESQESIV